jgi:AraC-like DNA-binding protein
VDLGEEQLLTGKLHAVEDVDAPTACRRVGYEDASYLSREYKSLFGAPPMRDVQQLRATATVGSDL